MTNILFSEYNFFKVNFIDPASPLMYGIIELHDHIFFFLNMILFLVLFLLVTTIRYFIYKKNSRLNRYLLSQATKPQFDWLKLNHGTNIEIIWTVVPSLILILIAIPSFALLYATDELVDPSVTVQVIGHQWYWSYEYNDLVTLNEVSSPALKTPSLTQSVFYDILTNPYATIKQPNLTQSAFYDILTNPYATIKQPNLTQSAFYDILTNPYATIKQPNLTQSAFYDILTNPYSAIKQQSTNINFSLTQDSFYKLLTNPEISLNKFLSKNLNQEFLTGTIEFDSYMRQESDLQPGELRLYETDFPLVLPKFTHIRFMITADDVIHSWSVPALGIKVDAVPGRINHAHTYIKYSGIFYGQCSELCGVNHAFMPIQILVFEPQLYYDYLRLLVLSK